MTELLSKEDKVQFLKDVFNLKHILNDIVSFYKKNLILFNGVHTINYTVYLLDIISRFRYNCESLENLMDAFSRDYRLKISVNLLLRSIAADQLTGLYLLTFYDEKDNTLNGLKNELKVISAEYLHFIKKTLRTDHDLLVELGFDKHENFERKKEWFTGLDPELLDSNGEILKNKKLRESTPVHLKSGMKNKGLFLTENQKYKHIKERGFSDYGFIYVAFNYYSQYQHFNLMSRKLIENNPKQDTFYMALMLEHMLRTSDMLLQLLKAPNPDFRNEINEIRQRINTCFAFKT